MQTRKVVIEESNLGKALNEIERILHENNIEISVRDNSWYIHYDGKYINIVDTYSNEKTNKLPRKYYEEKFVVVYYPN